MENVGAVRDAQLLQRGRQRAQQAAQPHAVLGEAMGAVP